MRLGSGHCELHGHLPQLAAARDEGERAVARRERAHARRAVFLQAASVTVRVEHLGDQTRLHLTLDGHDIVTLTDVHTDLGAGDEIAIQPRNPLYFDAGGDRIA